LRGLAVEAGALRAEFFEPGIFAGLFVLFEEIGGGFRSVSSFRFPEHTSVRSLQALKRGSVPVLNGTTVSRALLAPERVRSRR